MQEIYTEKYFINPAIEYGIRSYLKNKIGNNHDRIYTFEMHVIKTLTIIYGEKAILLPYKIDNETAFKCNLLIYGLKEKDMEDFIKYMNEYYLFMKNIKSEQRATGLISEIEKILIEMILKRSKKHEYTSYELSEFDKIFNPIGELKEIKSLVSADKGLIIREWENNKGIITNTQMKLRAINPNLLNPLTYSKYGYDIKTIAELSEDEINQVNSIIVKEESKDYLYDRKLPKDRRIILTTGYVYIDILILASIIATEIMVGFIAVSAIWG